MRSLMRSWKPPWRRPKANLLLILILITTATAHAVATPDSCNAAATDGGGAAAAAATAAPATVHSTNHAIGATTGPARFAAGGCSVHCHSFRSRAEGSMVTEFSTDALKQECAKHHMVKDTVASVEQQQQQQQQLILILITIATAHAVAAPDSCSAAATADAAATAAPVASVEQC